MSSSRATAASRARRIPRTVFLTASVAAPALIALLALGWVGDRRLEEARSSAAARELVANLRLVAARLPQEPTPSELAELAREGDLRLWLVDGRGRTLGTPSSGRVVGTADGTAVELLAVPGASRPFLRARVELPASETWRSLRGVTQLPGADGSRAAWWLAVGVLGILATLLSAGVGILAAGRLRDANRVLGAALRTVPSDAEPVEAAEAARDRLEMLEDEQRDLAARHEQLRWVLASMIEGVIVVGPDDLVVFLNPAAEDLLGVDARRAHGSPLAEIVRDLDLHRLVGEARSAERPIEREVVLRGERERSLQVHCSLVHAPGRVPMGTVLVLNDVTRLRRLERVRRDFVANVSHEIRTPITTIAGFVETLLDGALESPDEAEEFLRIIKRHADRLNAIVEDLLVLARVEQEDERSIVRLERGALSEVLAGAVDACRFKAEAKGVDLRLAVPADLEASVNGPLLEQAVVNLIDNAVKYSESGAGVDVTAVPAGDGVRIDVRDHGVGVGAADLPRLFERFYRVDRARSRKLGGTGLGLAIVKHIAQVHGGRASVVSKPGHGSTFSIHLPAVADDIEQKRAGAD